MTTRPSRSKVILAAVALAGIAVAAFIVLRRQGIGVADLTEWLRAAGDTWWAPLVFIALYTLFNVFLIPATVLTLTAGVVWGWFFGGLWVLAASTAGSAVPYFIGRSGAGWVAAKLEEKAGRLHRALRSEGFTSLLLMRLVPIVPYNLLNYAAGAAGIRPRHYLLATFIGTIPGIFIFTYLASSIATGLVSPKTAFVRTLIAGALLAALALASRFFSARVKARLHA
ncbi:MAG TPA: TVP38/TMEM64 family protein [Thermoanaerobaculia bacterium]|nr:TVP38/TMEM64 family protein [Thermoanaerobaculia bacterium]